jgi:hypothetical protein
MVAVSYRMAPDNGCSTVCKLGMVDRDIAAQWTSELDEVCSGKYIVAKVAIQKLAPRYLQCLPGYLGTYRCLSSLESDSRIMRPPP